MLHHSSYHCKNPPNGVFQAEHITFELKPFCGEFAIQYCKNVPINTSLHVCPFIHV
jgi:hypothetical protein